MTVGGHVIIQTVVLRNLTVIQHMIVARMPLLIPPIDAQILWEMCATRPSMVLVNVVRQPIHVIAMRVSVSVMDMFPNM